MLPRPAALSKVLAGHPSFEVMSGEVLYDGKNLLELEPDERAREGVFMAFQYPVEVPGVSNSLFLRLAYNEKMKHHRQEELDPLEFNDYLKEKAKIVDMDPQFFKRSVNEGFSGGEKKRFEALQMAVQVLERDSGEVLRTIPNTNGVQGALETLTALQLGHVAVGRPQLGEPAGTVDPETVDGRVDERVADAEQGGGAPDDGGGDADAPGPDGQGGPGLVGR